MSNMQKVAIELGYSPVMINAAMSTHKFRNAGECAKYFSAISGLTLSFGVS